MAQLSCPLIKNTTTFWDNLTTLSCQLLQTDLPHSIVNFWRNPMTHPWDERYIYLHWSHKNQSFMCRYKYTKPSHGWIAVYGNVVSSQNTSATASPIHFKGFPEAQLAIAALNASRVAETKPQGLWAGHSLTYPPPEIAGLIKGILTIGFP